MFRGSFRPRPPSSRSPVAILGTPAASLGPLISPISGTDFDGCRQFSGATHCTALALLKVRWYYVQSAFDKADFGGFFTKNFIIIHAFT